MRTPTLRQMESLNMDRAAPVLIRTYKEERTLEVWKQDRAGKFALLKSYPICKYSGKLGPKSLRVIIKRRREFMTSLQTRLTRNRANISPSILVSLMPLTNLSGGPAVFLWCMAAVDQSAVTP